ncbi:MAG: hypothetical protein ACO4AY_12885 [Ilumatobacteraceae bacterium]
MSSVTTDHVIHNRVRLALHTLRPGRVDAARPTLLLLHGLGE